MLTGLVLAVYLRLSWNSPFSCLSLLSADIITALGLSLPSFLDKITLLIPGLGPSVWLTFCSWLFLRSLLGLQV